MAKATAICTCKFCGKKFEKIAYKRNRSEADSWTEWAEANIDQCPECYREAAAEEAAETAQAAGLPELTGSPKQIAWAEQIRAKMWGAYLEEEKKSEEWSKENDKMEEFAKASATGRRVFQTVTSAKEYIDNRDQYVFNFIGSHIESK